MTRFAILFYVSSAISLLLTEEKLAEDFKLGRFTRMVYKGNWSSNSPNQADFLQSKEGLLFLTLRSSLKEPKKVELRVVMLEEETFDSKLMTFNSSIVITDPAATSLAFAGKTNLTKYTSIMSDDDPIECDIGVSINLKNSAGQPVNVTDEKTSDLRLTGQAFSKTDKCVMNFDMDVQPEYIDYLAITLFVFPQLGMIFAGFMAFYKAIRTDDVLKLMNISESAFIVNVVVDIVMVNVLITFMMAFLAQYTQYFLIIFIFSLFVMAVKIRFLMQITEIRFNQMPQENQRALTIAKIIFFVKLFAGFLAAGGIASLLVYYNRLFYLIFLYPCFQIYYNCRFVTQKNCFYFDIHLPLFGSQVFLPVFLRMGSNVFNLRPNYPFVLTLLLMVSVQLFILYLQSKLGPMFFIPPSWRPNYFNYVRKIVKTQPIPECPICFAKLDEDPTHGEGGVHRPLTMQTYYQTPCGHQFHEHCLREWMDSRLVCPCCRKPLPSC